MADDIQRIIHEYAKRHRPLWICAQLPALVAESNSIAGWGTELHEGGGTVGYFLIGVHAAAALFHHCVVKDNTLLRMLPHRE